MGFGMGVGTGVGTDGFGPGVSVGVGAGLPNALELGGVSAEELESILRRNEDEMARLRLSWEACQCHHSRTIHQLTLHTFSFSFLSRCSQQRPIVRTPSLNGATLYLLLCITRAIVHLVTTITY